VIDEPRDIGEAPSDKLFRTGRFAPRVEDNETWGERISPARAALMSGAVVSDTEALREAAAAIVDEMGEESIGRRGPLSGAARRLRGV
jgi:hypothetical protein